eukprot:3147726-Prymnesium_polylepis.1
MALEATRWNERFVHAIVTSSGSVSACAAMEYATSSGIALNIAAWPKSLDGRASNTGAPQLGGRNLGRLRTSETTCVDTVPWGVRTHRRAPRGECGHAFVIAFDRSKEFRERASLPSFAE